jgi:hypothetical protein
MPRIIKPTMGHRDWGWDRDRDHHHDWDRRSGRHHDWDRRSGHHHRW